MTASRITCDSAATHNTTRKLALRTTLLAQRQALAPEEKKIADQSLCDQVMSWWETHPVTSLGVYLPIRHEPDLADAYRQLCAHGVQLALPVVRDKAAPLDFIQWHPDDPVIRGAFGTAVPAGNTPAQPEALLLPCVGFNTQKFRLGYGGGFYDRTLSTTPRPLAIGIAYDAAHADFAGEAHDIALDCILTNQRIIP